MPARSRSAEGFHEVISRAAKFSGSSVQHYRTVSPLSTFNIQLSTSLMNDTLGTREYYWWLLAILAAICPLGVMVIYSSTHGSSLAGMRMRQVPCLVIVFLFMVAL